MTYEYSCGAVVFTRDFGSIRYALVRQSGGQWGFPKGHMESGETETETAIREIGEETGLSPVLLPGFRVTVEYPLPARPGVTKRVVYYLGEFTDQKPVPRPGEILDARLADYDNALSLLTYQSARDILSAVHSFLQRSIH